MLVQTYSKPYIYPMKKCFYLLMFVGLSQIMMAQNFTVVGDTANLGNVYENSPDSLYVKLVNNGTYTVEIDRIFGFPFYGDTVVVGNASGKTIAAGDSLGLWVVGSPEHNLMHKGSILVHFKRSPYGSAMLPYKFQGKYSNTYYAATENKTELDLRTQLKATISAGYISLSYNAARDNMYATLDNNNGDVECVYTGRTATFNSRPGANSNNFNCEHTFPQSLFSQNLPMRSDIHHLFSTDVTANSQRGNLPFGVVSNPTWTVGGSKKNNSTFEPRDLQKGATARSMMYFVLRYQDYSNFFAGQESIFKQWHQQYPPSQIEKDRNNGIFALQNNRSPFVDYPQFSERITNLVGNTSTPDVEKIHVSEDSIYLMEDMMFAPLVTYSVYVYNYGNKDISVSNLALSNLALIFTSGSGANATIGPGENLQISFSYSTLLSFTNESLSFNTTAPGKSSVSIPINSVNPFSVKEQNWNPQLTITNAEISWQESTDDFNFILIDMLGRVQCKGSSAQQKSINLKPFVAGTYILKLSGKKGVYSTKINVTH